MKDSLIKAYVERWGEGEGRGEEMMIGGFRREKGRVGGMEV